MSNTLANLTQEELFRVLRGILKTTQNDLLPNLAEIKRVQALFSAINPSTWKKACERHFALSLEKEEDRVDPRAVYLQHYPKNRFQV
jgi:hypothetical protein